MVFSGIPTDPIRYGPDMKNGKELLKCFKEFFYSERKHYSGERKMHSLLNAFVKKTNIEIDGTFFKYHELPQNSDRTKTIIDLQSRKDSRGNFNLENDFFAKALHYSDWIYLMPLCPMINFQFKCEADDPNWHGEGPWPRYTINSLPEGELQIFHHRDLKCTYDGKELTEYDEFGLGKTVFRSVPSKEEISETDGKLFDKYGAEIDKDGNPIDERDAEYKREYRELPLDEDDPDPKELLDVFDDPEFTSEDEPKDSPFKKIATCKGNPDGSINEEAVNDCLKDLGDYLDREEDAKKKPSTRYEEIIIAYRDGARDCLVVRTEDNKQRYFQRNEIRRNKMGIALELAVILIFLAIATFIVTRFFIKHSRRKNDPLTNDLNMIFFRDQNKIKKGK